MFKFFFLYIAVLALSFIEESFQTHKSSYDFESTLQNLKISARRYDDDFGKNLRKISIEQKLGTLYGLPGSYKFKLIEKVIPCDELPEYLDEEELDCQPIDEHVSNEYHPPNGSSTVNNGYLKKTEVRFEVEHEIFDVDHWTNCVIHFFPMRETEVESAIEATLEKTNLNCLNFSEPLSFESGYFFHSTFNGSLPMTCEGKLLTAINVTENEPDISPLYLSEINWISEGLTNGFLLSLPGAECRMEGDLFSAINLDFTIIKSLQFPYLVVSHDVEIFPMLQLFSYKARLFQEEHDPLNQESYDTNIEIRSSSVLPFLNFELRQQITNLNESTGYEQMTLMNSGLGVVAVFANWSEQAYNKSVNLYSFSDDPQAPKLHNRGVNHTDTLIHFRYNDKEENDHIFFTFGIKRDLFRRKEDKQKIHKSAFKEDLKRFEL